MQVSQLKITLLAIVVLVSLQVASAQRVHYYSRGNPYTVNSRPSYYSQPARTWRYAAPTYPNVHYNFRPMVPSMPSMPTFYRRPTGLSGNNRIVPLMMAAAQPFFHHRRPMAANAAGTATTMSFTDAPVIGTNSAVGNVPFVNGTAVNATTTVAPSAVSGHSAFSGSTSAGTQPPVSTTTLAPPSARPTSVATGNVIRAPEHPSVEGFSS